MDLSLLPMTALVVLLEHVDVRYRFGVCALVCSTWASAEATSITLQGAPKPNEGFGTWLRKHLHSLQSLHVVFARRTGSPPAIMLLDQLLSSQLRHIHLGQCLIKLPQAIHDATDHPVSTALRSLSLCDIHLRKAGVEVPALLRVLACLDTLCLRRISGWGVMYSDDGPIKLGTAGQQTLTALTSLDLESGPGIITNGTLQGIPLSSLTKLQHLRLSSLARISASVLAGLQELQELTSLELSNVTKVPLNDNTGSWLAMLSKLQHLSLSEATGLQPSLLSEATGLKHLHLRQVTLYQPPPPANTATAAGTAAAAAAGGGGGGGPISNSSSTQSTSAAELLALLPQLQHLTHLTLESVGPLSHSLSNSHYLVPTAGATMPEAPAFAALTDSYSSLKHLDLTKCHLPGGAQVWRYVFDPQLRPLTQLTLLHVSECTPRLQMSDIQRLVQCCTGTNQSSEISTDAAKGPAHPMDGTAEEGTPDTRTPVDQSHTGAGLNSSRSRSSSALRDLNILGSVQPGADLAALSALTALTCLYVSQATDAALQGIGQRLSHLHELKLCESIGVTVKGLVHLTQLQQLTYLVVPEPTPTLGGRLDKLMRFEQDPAGPSQGDAPVWQQLCGQLGLATA